jgi:hypothetical protein
MRKFGPELNFKNYRTAATARNERPDVRILDVTVIIKMPESYGIPTNASRMRGELRGSEKRLKAP